MQTIIGKQFPSKVIPLIEQAKTSLDIIVFDWRWYPQDPGAPCQLFNQAIARAIRRGVKVRAIAQAPQIIETLKSIGAEAKKLEIKSLVHVKLMIIDREKAVIGSHNYTQNAFTTNLELSLVVDKQDDLSDIFSFFENLWGS